MDLSFTPAQEAFREEVRRWIAEALPPHLAAKAAIDGSFSMDEIMEWHRILYAKGWVAPHWPEAVGGPGWDAATRFIFSEELERAGTPQLSPFGLSMVGPLIIQFGTDAQKQRFLPKILSGEEVWCQGYSEPNAGSDLASLRTEARDEGDHFVVNGQKTWTTYAQYADWIFCLVRTDKANKYQGITFMLFDMESPGVTTKPILLISGNSPFCETFFDDVKVPKTQFVGEVGRGWDVAKYLLGHEREMISGGGAGGDMVSIGGAFAKAIGRNEQGELDDPILRAEMAAFDVDVFAYRAMGERFMDMWKTGRAHPASSNMMKYVGTELNKRRHELVMAGGGSEALEWDSEDSKGGARARTWLRTKANSIEGGTSEVMLNVIAKRILDLPGA